jgi:predicted nucleic acid-binding protein
LKFVLDNSVSARWLLNDGSAADLQYASRVRDALVRAKAIVPSLWALELANVIAREERDGFPVTRTALFLESIAGLNIILDAETYQRALTDTLDIARTYKITTYDAAYLEIALRSEVPIATLDQGLLKAAKKVGIDRFEP